MAVETFAGRERSRLVSALVLGLIVISGGPAGFSVYESCVPFADGFESGDAAAWSASQR